MHARKGPKAALLAAMAAGMALVSATALCAAIIPAPTAALPDPLADIWNQVRIEQHIQIRISPGAPVVPPDMLVEMREERTARFEERPMAKCVAIGSIAAVQSGEGNRLLLFMRDQHIVTAALEKACRAHDFYSGFYIERNGDGMLCADRDKLQSRSGANCRIKRMRALVEAPARRAP